MDSVIERARQYFTDTILDLLAELERLRERITSLEARLAEAEAIVVRKDVKIDKLRAALRQIAEVPVDEKGARYWHKWAADIAGNALNPPRRKE